MLSIFTIYKSCLCTLGFKSESISINFCDFSCYGLSIQNSYSSPCLSCSDNTWQKIQTHYLDLFYYFHDKVFLQKKLNGDRGYLDHSSRALFTLEVKSRTHDLIPGYITPTLREWECMLLFNSIFLFIQSGILIGNSSIHTGQKLFC